MDSKKKGMERRDFLKTAAAATVFMTAGGMGRAFAKGKSPNERIGVGMIGAGGRAGGHLQAYNWLKEKGLNIEIVAVCDTYRPRLNRAAESYKAKPYMKHQDLLADPNVDVVSIATPDHLHGYQAIDAINAGKDVYCEKPVTHWRQFELTKRLTKVVAESQQVFQLGTQAMSDPAWHEMRRLVKEGLIGQPLHAECGYFRVGDWGERGMPIDDPNVKPGADLDWEAFLGDSPKREFDVSRYFRWRMYEDYAGGPSTDLFPHSLTPTLYILGLGMPAMAVATGGMHRYQEREVPDTFNTLIEFPEKVTIAVLGTQGNDYSGTGSRGAGGRIPVIRGWDGTLTLQDNDILFIPAEGSNKKEQRFKFEGKEDGVGFFKQFIECCQKRDRNTPSPMDLGFKVQTALQMGSLALREGKVARYNTEKETIEL